jgi:uncharacterized RDD family membrane protein YckC
MIAVFTRRLASLRTLAAVAVLAACSVVTEAHTPALSISDGDAASVSILPPIVSVHVHGEHHGNSIVNVGHDSDLPSGQRADAVVAVFGSASSEGDANAVVSLLGNTRVTGPLGDSAVAVLGNTYVNSTTGGDVVAVLGSVELGPNANVGGDVVALGGTVHRDPAALVHGDVQQVLGGVSVSFDWLHSWVQHCLLYLRPLAIAPGLGWAWGVALAFLAIYLCFALLFPVEINRCVTTIETQPGHTVLAALLTMLLIPLAELLLAVTVIGIPAVPLVMLSLFCARLFGTAAVLAWLGQRVLRGSGSASNHPALAALIGGVIVLALYLVPVLGGVTYAVLRLLGLGVVIYTLIRLVGERRSVPGNGTRAAPPSGAAAADTLASPTTLRAAGLGPEPTSAPPASGAATAAAGPAAATADPIAVTSPRAGFWMRMAALLIDSLLIGIVLAPLPHASHFRLLVLAAYGAILWKLRGSTVGGSLFNLKVVRLDGREIDWPTAIVRALGCFLSFVVVGLGFFWIAFDEGKQAWHDKIAGTAVVRVAKGVSLV